MALNEKSQEIHNAFCSYVKTHDKKAIESFSRADIEFTIIQSRDIGWPHYKAMEMRVAQLKEIEKSGKEMSNAIGNSEYGFIKYKEGIYWSQIQKEYEISKKEFGRRINFIKNVFKRKIIFRDIEQAYVFSKNGFNKPALILAGAVIEELLRLYLESKGILLKDNKFAYYIECCEKNGLLKKAIHHQTIVARLFRNIVHLSNENEKKHSISIPNAKGAVASIFVIANDF
jgi:hypothetical protein